MNYKLAKKLKVVYQELTEEINNMKVNRIIQGNCIDVLKKLPSECVDI